MNLPFKKLTGAVVGSEKVADFDFKNHYPDVNSNMAWSKIVPHIRQAIRAFVLPYLGEVLYDDICAKIATPPGGGLTSAQEKFAELLKDVSAHYGVVAAMQKGKTILASMGPLENNPTENTTSASQWGFRTTLWSVAQDADRMMDEMLAFLEAQVDKATPDTYFVTNWKNQPAYNELAEGFFRQVSDFQFHHDIQRSLRAFKSLVPIIAEQSEYRILPVLGQEQYDLLLDAVKNNDATLDEKGLIHYVRKALAKWTIAEATAALPIIVERAGFRVISNTDSIDQRAYSTEVTQSAIQGLRESATRSAQTATADLVNYLYANPDKFPTWRDSTANKSSSTGSCVVGGEFGGVFI